VNLVNLNKHCFVAEYFLLHPVVVPTIKVEPKYADYDWNCLFMLALLVLLCIYIPVGERRNCVCDSWIK